jgi:hypothetical protein
MSNNYYPNRQNIVPQNNSNLFNNINKKNQSNLDMYSLNDEPILVYDSFDDDSDDVDENIKQEKDKKKALKKIRKVFQIIKKENKHPIPDQQQKQQQPDQLIQPTVPRVASKTKTIIIQNEQGKELSRIVSSRPRYQVTEQPQFQPQQYYVDQNTYYQQQQPSVYRKMSTRGKVADSSQFVKRGKLKVNCRYYSS